MNEEMKRVIVTKTFVGIFMMQVCAIENATDAEILNVCNAENPSGTQNGWVEVIRIQNEFIQGPCQCDKYQDRKHFLVSC